MVVLLYGTPVVSIPCWRDRDCAEVFVCPYRRLFCANLPVLRCAAVGVRMSGWSGIADRATSRFVLRPTALLSSPRMGQLDNGIIISINKYRNKFSALNEWNGPPILPFLNFRARLRYQYPTPPHEPSTRRATMNPQPKLRRISVGATATALFLVGLGQSATRSAGAEPAVFTPAAMEATGGARTTEHLQAGGMERMFLMVRPAAPGPLPTVIMLHG